MHPFTFIQTQTPAAAFEAMGGDPQSCFFAGGTTLLDLMKLDVMSPNRLVDINSLPFTTIDVTPQTVTVGAGVRNSDLANHPMIRQKFPVLSSAVLAGASAQLRNMATTAGNLLQRTRCSYFRDAHANCNKRLQGSGCAAMHGFNRGNAVLGTSDACIATHPSDMCTALIILDAAIQTLLPNGAGRTIPISDFHLAPGATPHLENVLQPGELITHVHLPVTPLSANSHYLKVRDRASYEFALASAAVALTIENNTVKAARVGLGGIATRPWRSTEAEAALVGRPATTETFRAAATAALASAKPAKHNAFKVDLARRTLVLALQQLTS